MTVCIAAICDDGDSVAIALDERISMESFSGDTTQKGARLHKRWLAMYAGNDLGRVGAVMARVSANLSMAGRPEVPPLHIVENFFLNAYQLERRAEAVNQVLSPYGIGDLDTFFQRGPEMFGDGFNEIRQQLSSTSFECYFLVAGFHELNVAGLFQIYPPGRSYRCVTDFLAIGSGADSAMSSLMFRAHKSSVPHQLGLYHVCEAKFMAESALAVGTTTVVGVFKSDGSFGRLSQKSLQAIRERWAKDGVPKIPADIQTEVERGLQWHKGRSYGPKTADKPWP